MKRLKERLQRSVKKKKREISPCLGQAEECSAMSQALGTLLTGTVGAPNTPHTPRVREILTEVQVGVECGEVKTLWTDVNNRTVGDSSMLKSEQKQRVSHRTPEGEGSKSKRGAISKINCPEPRPGSRNDSAQYTHCPVCGEGLEERTLASRRYNLLQSSANLDLLTTYNPFCQPPLQRAHQQLSRSNPHGKGFIGIKSVPIILNHLSSNQNIKNVAQHHPKEKSSS